ncbi:hypothetical protein QFZ33_003197 [Arthrobacter globiformis]|nr:hypothetical protein [Arthrobacter globiformis]
MAVDSKSRIYIADTGSGRVVRMDGIDGSGWVSFGVGGTPTVAAIGAKRISRLDAATGALTAATPANSTAAAGRMVTINDTFSQVTTQIHLADLNVRQPMGMVVW